MANMLLLNPFQMSYQEVNVHTVNFIQDVNLDAPASSATEGGQAQGGAFGGMGGFLWILVILALMMIMMRPRQDKEGEKFRNALQKDQDVVTSTGIFGKVKDIDEVSVTLEIAQGMKINRLVATKTEGTKGSAAGPVPRLRNASLTDAKGYDESVEANRRGTET